MQSLPLTELPHPLLLVISNGDLLAHTTDPQSPWHTYLESRMGLPWLDIFDAAFENAAAAATVSQAMADTPSHGQCKLPLHCDDAWVQLSAQWQEDSVSKNHYITLAIDLEPLAAARAEEDALQAVSKPALLVRLKQAESKLETYLHHFPGVLFSQRPDGSCAFVSPRMKAWIGDTADKLTRSSGIFTALIAPEDRERTLETIRDNSPKGEPYSLQYRLLHPESHAPIYVYDIRLPIVLKNGKHLQDEGIWIDVTRQAVAENRISTSLWKENLAAITSGLVHDFSNSMAGIYSLSELYHDEMEADHPRHEGMGQIKAHAMRAQRLVRRIVDMNREIAGEINYHNLEVLIRDLEDIIHIILPKSARLDFEFPDAELLVSIDEVAFRQAFTHFVTNFRDAKPEGGTFGVAVECVENGYNLHIWDDGPGIAPEIASKVFDAFFSTKTDKEAAGFGLYAARAFAESAGGHLSLGSGRYPGAHFVMFLPDADSARQTHSDFGQLVDTPPSSSLQSGTSPETATKGSLFIISPHPAQAAFLSEGLAGKPWALDIFPSAHEAAEAIDNATTAPNVILFLTDADSPLNDPDIEPLSPWAEEAMTAVFMLPDTPRPPSSVIESCDMLLDTSLGMDGLIDRLTPWMA